VEESLIIKAQDFDEIVRHGGTGSYQSMSWRRAFVGFFVEGEDGNGRPLRLKYELGEGENARELDYRVRMVKTSPHFGGVRWYFICPLIVNGRPCLRRVSKLYLPPGGLYFGCRECYGLTYTSCQESHKLDRLYKALAAGMSEDIGRAVSLREVKTVMDGMKRKP